MILNNISPSGLEEKPISMQIEGIFSESRSGNNASSVDIVNKYAMAFYCENNIYNTRGTLDFLKESIIQNFKYGSDELKLDMLHAIDHEISKAIDLSNEIKFFNIKKFFPYSKACKIYNGIFYLKLLRYDNPFVNKGYDYRKSIAVWLKILIVLVSVSFLDFIFVSISLAHPSPAKVLIWEFSAHSLAIWISAITASALGAWLPFGHILGERDSMFMEEYTLRAQVTAMLGTSIVLGTLLITIMTCLNESFFDQLVAPGARELFEIGICGVVGAGDAFVWNILRRVVRFIKP